MNLYLHINCLSGIIESLRRGFVIPISVFAGTIPSALGDLSKLINLYLYNNLFSGI